jgi:hypothetical protein
MKTAAIILATLGLAVAGSAIADDHLSAVDYIKASRCKGLAEGLGATANISGLDALVKSEGAVQPTPIYTRAQDALQRAKRDASHDDSKERLTAELNGPCMAFMGGGKVTASAR